MSDVCSCNSTWDNLAQGCADDVGELIKAVYAQSEKTDGTDNCIDTDSDTINQALFEAATTGKFTAEDQQNRWLVTGSITNVEPIVVDDIIDTSNRGAERLVAEGAKGLRYRIYSNQPEKLKAYFNTLACRDLVFYGISDKGHLLGEKDGTNLCGRAIEANTLRTKVVPKDLGAGTAAYLEVVHFYKTSSSDEKIDFISASQMNDYDITKAKGLLNVLITFTANTTTAVTFDLYTNEGPVGSKTAVTGVTSSDVEVYNSTDSAVATLSTLVESSDGTYVGTFDSAQDASDVVYVRGTSDTNVLATLRYDLKDVRTVTATLA